MADKTGIEWTDATWNPIRGCSRVSEGCRHCYAEGVAYRFSGPGQPYEGLVQIGADGERRRQWNGSIQFVEKHLLDPLSWKRPRRIFVNSMSDLFHDGVTDEQLDRIFAVMALCPQHTFQVLTKRPERMRAYLSNPEREKMVARACIDPDNDYPVADGFYSCDEPGNLNLYEVFWKNCRLYFKDDESDVVREAHRKERWMQFVAADFHWPLPNVWLGVSVEDQAAADARIPLLLRTPAAKRFVSCEPLLGAVNLCQVGSPPWPLWGPLSGYCARHYPKRHCGCERQQASIDWVIIGGESGDGARPMHIRWVRDLVEDCVLGEVPVFFKQWGEWGISSAVCTPGVHTGGGIYLRPDGQMGTQGDWWAGRAVAMDRVGKKAAGCLLDGVQYHQFPAVMT